MIEYKNIIKSVLDNGTKKNDRTGTGVLSLFGSQIRFDLSKGFPLVTTKKIFWKGVVIELLWFMSGNTNIKKLNEYNVNIWNEWADENGNLGPVYGKQWRNWSGNDQLKSLIDNLKNNPDSRRHIISAWNVGELDKMALPPCHSFFQFYISNGKLSCQLYQRSADLFLGVPFNIASYSLLTHLLAHEIGLKVGDFIHTFGDLHIYNNHIPQCNEILTRDVKPLPSLEINIQEGLLDFIDRFKVNMTWEEISKVIVLKNYIHHPALKGKVSV